MASASEWVRQIVANSQSEPMTTDAVWKSLEKHIGQGDRALDRIRDVQCYIDQQLVDHRGGHVMRDLWHAVTDYLEKVQEAAAAA